MRHVAIVANQTAMDDQLLDVVQSLVAHEPCTFRLVVPVTPLTAQEASLRTVEFSTNRSAGEAAAVTLARHRLHAAQSRLADLGIAAEGDTGDPNPVKAVAAVHAMEPFDLVVVATLPRQRSRWLRADVPGRLRRKLGVPVLHVETGVGERRGARHAADRSPLVQPLRH